jgi:hypothetical protein
MRQLTTLWSDEPDIADKIIASNRLAQQSRTRLSDLIGRSFVPRYVRGPIPNLWKPLALLEQFAADVGTIKALHYYATAQSEFVIKDFVIDFIFKQRGSTRLDINVMDLVKYLRSQPIEKFGGQRWSEGVQKRVARGVLAALRDFGILEGKSKKMMAPFHLSTNAFVIISHLMMSKIRSGEKLVNNNEWELFLMTPRDVEQMFLEAHQLGYLHYQAAGKVVSINYPTDSIEEYISVTLKRTN